MKRVASVIKLRPEHYDAYKEVHANVWPEVLETIRRANICNYSIYHHDGLLFSYFEYIGDDFEADIASIADDPKTREWWQITDPMQESVIPGATGSADGPWWLEVEELFHTD